jgi:hypothetical protein
VERSVGTPANQQAVVGPGFLLADIYGGVASGKGDSGGPVYQIDDANRRVALGLVSATRHAVTCGQYPLGPPNLPLDPVWPTACFSEVYVVAISDALRNNTTTFKPWAPLTPPEARPVSRTAGVRAA